MMVDSRTPVVVGVGQAIDRIDSSEYRQMSSVDLSAAAARAALEDTEVRYADAAASVELIAGVRQFEISAPVRAPLGRSDNYPRSVARRLGIDPARAVLEVVGGQGPQHLLTEFAADIAAGRLESVLITGSDAISTERHYAGRDDRPDFTETAAGPLEDRGFGYESFVDDNLIAHAVMGAPTQYGLLENARRARVGATPQQYRLEMGKLLAPFTSVAAKNPLAAAPVERSAEELATVTDSNRMICDPFPRLMVARDLVNLGAAAVVMSLGKARRLGIPDDKLVYLRGHADLEEQTLLARPDLGAAPTAWTAAREALRVAGIGLDDLTTLDLYSCFPVAVFNFCDGTGLATDDPRGLTVTGGLPFFGGPGNNYSMHAIAETVARMRDQPGAFGLVGANGGIMSKYSVGVYSTTPAPWEPDRSAHLQRAVASAPQVPSRARADGPARIETYTVRHAFEPRTGLVVGRLHADNSRFLAIMAPESLAAVDDPIGRDILVTSSEKGNTAVMVP
ncbi:acetyl-CoA acetyltransferase [Nocardia nova]|uniref:acetyl-CoA acetyltransferase n=2 Tax=Nocardia nova TaxID=37330 RepID=UPI0018933C96|nr:acetyl-CoA acetyltransferase [Nocardia nova]MBF6146314.1 acetyl-CoA acetyltransferase [Nocardia nova]